MDDYTKLSLQYCKRVTNHYSTSFSLGIRLLDKRLRPAVYAVYAMVRMADEIVDTYYHINQAETLTTYKEETFRAIEKSYSINPVLHGFQWAVHTYGIRKDLIESFFESMEMDLEKKVYSCDEYHRYIYGSAEVVGMMCLAIFCKGNRDLCTRLEVPAKHLGSALQKVNFLRDLQSDYADRGRSYFPHLQGGPLTLEAKRAIEEEIEEDFAAARAGLDGLPNDASRGVRLAYRYYYELFKIIKRTEPSQLLDKRIRLGGMKKTVFLIASL